MYDNSPLGSACIEHLDGNRYRCKNTGLVIVTDVLPIHCCSADVLAIPFRERPSLSERIREHLQQLPDVTRSPEDLDRIITICTTQCKRLGTGRWGEVNYEGCPRFGRPCTGAFKKWTTSIADAKTWCEPWGPEQGVFHDVGLTPAESPDTMLPTHTDP